MSRSLLQAIGRAIGRQAAKETVTPRFVADVMADEWERMALDPRWSRRADLLRAMAEKARHPSPKDHPHA